MARNPALAVAGIALTLAYFVSIWSELQSPANQPKKISPHIHLEPSDISLLQAQTATSVVFETAKGSPVIVVTPTPTPQPQPATATVLTADKDGHHKGDVIVSLPTQPATLLNQLIGQTGHCRAARFDRRGNGINLVEITNVAIFVLPNAAPHQLLDGFGIQGIPQQLLQFRGTFLSSIIVGFWLTVKQMRQHNRLSSRSRLRRRSSQNSLESWQMSPSRLRAMFLLLHIMFALIMCRHWSR